LPYISGCDNFGAFVPIWMLLHNTKEYNLDKVDKCKIVPEDQIEEINPMNPWK